jgi:hypothetical protein
MINDHASDRDKNGISQQDFAAFAPSILAVGINPPGAVCVTLFG